MHEQVASNPIAACRPGLHDEGARELLEEASAALGREDSALRVGLLASLARALEYKGDPERAAVARADAIAMARRIDMAQSTRQPFMLHVTEHYRSALALLEGRLDEADAAAERSREWGQLLLGRDASTDGAAAHFQAALALNRQMGATTWLAHTAYEYGRMLCACGERDQGERGQKDSRESDSCLAEQLLAEAALLAATVGMPTLLARVRALAPASSPPPPEGLSIRELDVLRLVARGLSNREIGAELYISEHTAANHVRGILRKTACSNRTEATAYAYRRGLAES